MKMSLNNLQEKLLSIYEKNKNNLFIKELLKLASYFFFIAYKTRLFLYNSGILKTYKLPAYVISIGNITSGGTGKTPLTIHLASYLLSLGYKVAVLSRGYKGSFNNSGVVLVSDGTDILADYDVCGDEPYLIAKRVPKALVLVSKNRINAGKSAIKLGANVLILDDGFQYLKLQRDENILTFDGHDLFGSGDLLPYGKLRELPDSIKRSTSIVISNPQEDINLTKKYSQGIKTLNVKYKIIEITSLNTKVSLKVENVKDLKLLAVCGIANPESFISLLKNEGLNAMRHIFFLDHHNYVYKDVENIIKFAEKSKIENIITTEKDSIKLEDICQAAPVTFWVCKIDIVWFSPEPYESLLRKKPTKPETTLKH